MNVRFKKLSKGGKYTTENIGPYTELQISLSCLHTWSQETSQKLTLNLKFSFRSVNIPSGFHSFLLKHKRGTDSSERFLLCCDVQLRQIHRSEVRGHPCWTVTLLLLVCPKEKLQLCVWKERNDYCSMYLVHYHKNRQTNCSITLTL